MRGLLALAPFLICACGSTLDSLGETGSDAGAAAPPSTPNAFRDVLGVGDAEIAARIDSAYQALFHGDLSDQAVFYPVGDGSAYIFDVGQQDIGLDGMGYGLMLAVQLDERADFDALWAFTQGRMLIREGTTAGYYSRGCNTSFQCTTETSPDASAFLATALILADARWGSSATNDYAGAARALLDTMLTKETMNGGVVDGVTNMFDTTARLVVLAPLGNAAALTQPSYIMPAFYEIWARFQSERAAQWRAIATAGRGFLRGVAHPVTGLIPRVASFDGTPAANEEGYYDWESARSAMHLALDHVWYGGSWQTDHATRLLGFLSSQGVDTYVNQYTLDGTAVGTTHTPAMVAMNGLGALMVPADTGRAFVQAVWDLQIPSGMWRYYDGMLYLLSLTGLSGNLRADF